ncbi:MULTISPECIES: PrsW family intramembrane metalloprotease [unclassified Nocardiopsis]|uniref:PrsW family intramembrane metalloprotease n=1 Tax=unclassified Nocardiopsis TaxID=2649073 RepID=UPI00066B0056|nr:MULTISPECIES: PrsW family intramembrane metalloprotease [unclassified Nocardiopsis]MBQ1082810.1 PrsW family intramembrane metalloprotease [Nocardiopsis sp. B62]
MSHARPEPDVPPTASGQVPTPRESDQGHEGTEHLTAPLPEPHRTQRLPALFATLALALLCLGGFVFTLTNFFGAMWVFPTETLAAAVVLGVAGVFGFWVLRRIRPVRPPSFTFSLLAVLWGLTGAIGLSLFSNTQLMSAWSRLGGVEFGSAWGAALTAPLNEELLKTAGVVLIAVMAARVVRGPVDGFVMGALVGLGFQLAEDFTYALNSIMMQGATDGVASVLQTLFLRVGLTGLGSHWAMSAIAGTAVGLLAASAWRPTPGRATGALLLFLLAIGVHWLFDAPLLEGLLGVLFKMLVVFLSALAVYFVARHAHRRRVRESLAVQGEELGMHRSAAVALASRHGRNRELGRVAAPERPVVRERQDQMVATAEDRASEYRG